MILHIYGFTESTLTNFFFSILAIVFFLFMARLSPLSLCKAWILVRHTDLTDLTISPESEDSLCELCLQESAANNACSQGMTRAGIGDGQLN